jgi:Phosphotransferase System HPr (HPr) Family
MNDMREFTYVITDREGIHARPAGLLVKEASKFSSTITLKKGDKSGDAKRIFAVMGLAAKKDEEIMVIAEGSDENEAVLAMETFLKANL